MKKYQLNLLISSIFLISFLYSDYAKLPIDKSSSLTKVKDKKNVHDNINAKKIKNGNARDINKAKNINKEKLLNKDLKAELVALENEFKAERAALRESYKKRRKAIYEKYGVNPPKNKRSNSDSDPSALWKNLK